MINEIKIDHTKPVWVNVWNEDGDKYKRIYLFSFKCRHYCVAVEKQDSYLKGVPSTAVSWDNIEFIKEKKRVPLDAKSCPRRPVLTHPVWGEGVEYYPSINENGLYFDKAYTWELLFEKGYMINGKPASREVDE